MAKKWPEMVLQQSFIKGHSFRITLYVKLILEMAYYWILSLQDPTNNSKFPNANGNS